MSDAAKLVVPARRAPRRASNAAPARIARLLAVGALALAGCRIGGPGGAAVPADAVTREAGPLRVSVALRPAVPRLGENRMLVWLRRPDGRPVHGAAVRLLVSMPAMGAMPRMESRARVREGAPGTYEAAYDLGMSGAWDMDLELLEPGQAEQHLELRVSTGLAGAEFAGGPEEARPAAPAAGEESAAGPASDAAAVQLGPIRRQEIGVRVEPVARRELEVRLRLPGRVAYDERRITEVALKYSGWVREVNADFPGRRVRAGEELFTAYSPDVYAAQQEYLVALRAAHDDTSHLAPGGLLDSARRRLLLWDLTPEQIDRLAREGRPREALRVVAPAGGVVMEQSVKRGTAFTAGQVLDRIAPTDSLWVLADVYQYQLPLVRPGMPATVLDPFAESGARPARVAYVYPTVGGDTRSGELRIEVADPAGMLKPGMFVDVDLALPVGRRLAVPASAVIYTGERRLVFVDRGGGWLAPREVRLGQRAGDWFEVQGGLVAGDRVVTSGNFLVASESRLKSALDAWSGGAPRAGAAVGRGGDAPAPAPPGGGR